TKAPTDAADGELDHAGLSASPIRASKELPPPPTQDASSSQNSVHLKKGSVSSVSAMRQPAPVLDKTKLETVSKKPLPAVDPVSSQSQSSQDQLAMDPRPSLAQDLVPIVADGVLLGYTTAPNLKRPSVSQTQAPVHPGAPYPIHQPVHPGPHQPVPASFPPNGYQSHPAHMAHRPPM
ncbi:hypothetical protein HDU91_004332, partial [Kappamyces sp. JEL0680]